MEATRPVIESFIDYKRIVLTLAGDLKRLQDFSEKLSLQNSIKLIDEVVKRIENDSFSIAIVGEFKRGKSTLINALLGQDILPSDILPCSATLNRVTYGLKPQVKVRFKDGREDEVAIDQLADYVTKLTPKSEANAETVQEAVVYYPVHYCQNNVDIIDTPGLNDDASMTEVTLSVLPQVDAAIMIIMAQSPFAEYERDFLENKLLTNDLGRVIFVVNAIDRVNRPEDAERVIKSIEDRIKMYVLQRAEEQFGKDSEQYKVYIKKIGKPRVFGLSAYQALDAKLNNDTELLSKSRFSEFESALEKFLTQDRGAVLLQVPVNRVIASGSEILKTINIQESALQMKQEEFREAYEASVTEIESIRQEKAKQMQQIDAAAEKTKHTVRPLINQLENDLKQAAEKVIDETPVTPAELSKTKAVAEKLSPKVSNAVQNARQKFAEKIQTEIQRELSMEVERLQEFMQSVDQSMHNIEMQFVQIDITSQRYSQGEAVAAAVAGATFGVLGGVWSGYRTAGAKGAAVGAAVSIPTAFVTGIFLAVVGLPLLPILLGMGAAGFLAAGKVTEHVFGSERVTNFKAAYKAKVFEEIEKQLKSTPINQQVNDHISDTFTALKRDVQEEVESLVNDTQNTLAELRGKRERHETLNENERKELDEIRDETQKILSNAQRLSEQLIQIISV